MDSQNRRPEMDVTKLYCFLILFWSKFSSDLVLFSHIFVRLVCTRMMSDFKVELDEDDMRQLVVEFHGPKDSPYEGGVWKILVTLLDDYPYKSPSVGFVNTIFHPNVEESSGSICLDVLNERWSPMFDLMNIFEIFLPQLLLYPNPSHPLNKDAAKLMGEDPTAFNAKVKEYIEMFAKVEDIAAEAEEKSSDGSEEDDSSNAKDEAHRAKSKDEAAAAEADSRK